MSHVIDVIETRVQVARDLESFKQVVLEQLDRLVKPYYCMRLKNELSKAFDKEIEHQIDRATPDIEGVPF